jgi:hypothetical protein
MFSLGSMGGPLNLWLGIPGRYFVSRKEAFVAAIFASLQYPVVNRTRHR